MRVRQKFVRLTSNCRNDYPNPDMGTRAVATNANLSFGDTRRRTIPQCWQVPER